MARAVEVLGIEFLMPVRTTRKNPSAKRRVRILDELGADVKKLDDIFNA